MTRNRKTVYIGVCLHVHFSRERSIIFIRLGSVIL